MEKAEKENNTDESDFSENEILDLNSLKPFEFESKTNIRVINSSSSDDQKQPLVVVPQKKCSFLLGLHIIRSSYQRCSMKKGVLENFAKFTGKHLCRPQACNFINKKTLAQVFSCEFCEIFKNNFFTEHLWTTASILWTLVDLF